MTSYWAPWRLNSLASRFYHVYSGADQRKHQSSTSLAFVRGISPVTGEFPSQRASNVETVSIWRRHHGLFGWYVGVHWVRVMSTIKPLIWGESNPKAYTFIVSSFSCLCPIHWSQVFSREWRYGWSSTHRHCSNYIWVINNFIAYKGATHSRGLGHIWISNPRNYWHV